MLAVAASLALGTMLLAASGSKLANRHGSLAGLETYGIRGRLAVAALPALIAGEAAIGAALVAGEPAARWAAAGLLASFACAQFAVLARGGGGLPCGCLGGRGRASARSAAAVALAAGAAGFLAASGAPGAGWPTAAVVAALALVAAGGMEVLRRPRGALDVAGEGPAIGETAPWLAEPSGSRLVLFVSDGCRLCRALRRRAHAVAAAAGAELVLLDEEADAQAWLAARIPGSPYAVFVDDAGIVRSKGTVNRLAQLRSLLPLGGESRRIFIERAAGAAAALTIGPSVGALVRPGEAEAYHFCGHIYTTDGCPHPTGLPRIDSKGFPLRAKDGHPVDDLGRLIDRDGTPLNDDGNPLLDPDGRSLPAATRTRVCTATARQYGLRLQVDGAWYRCCGGRVRKLIDCCTPGSRRINGDRALRGYCHGRRKVFCVMYFQTRVPC